ncbi:phage Gp37/Gp68 family protein [Methylobacterium sp. D48H]
MAETSSIEWTDATWQIVTGCTIDTPGCTNCYAMKLAGTRLRHHPSRSGLTRETKAGPVWTGEVRFNEQWLLQPLLWARGRNIFVAAHGDLFHPGVADEVLDRIFAVMAASSQHTFQVLTKRASRMRAYLSAPDRVSRIITVLEALSQEIGPGRNSRDPRGGAGWNCYAAAENLKLGNEQSSWPLWPLKNVWLGVSAEDQRRADERVPDLLATPAAVRFVSAEPLLGPIDFRTLKPGPAEISLDALTGAFTATASFAGGLANYQAGLDALPPLPSLRPGLDWIIVGGESGPGARPMHPDWARQIRDACAAAGVAFLFKQHGAWAPYARGTYRREGELLLMGDVTHAEIKRLDDEGAIQLWPDGGTNHVMAPVADSTIMRRVGKKAAGRLLDGVEHNGFPEVRP